MTHPRERESDRAAFFDEQKEAKHCIEVILSQVEACRALLDANDETIYQKLPKISSFSRSDHRALMREAINVARIYCRYADSEIDRIAKQVR